MSQQPRRLPQIPGARIRRGERAMPSRFLQEELAGARAHMNMVDDFRNQIAESRATGDNETANIMTNMLEGIGANRSYEQNRRFVETHEARQAQGRRYLPLNIPDMEEFEEGIAAEESEQRAIEEAVQAAEYQERTPSPPPPRYDNEQVPRYGAEYDFPPPIPGPPVRPRNYRARPEWAIRRRG